MGFNLSKWALNNRSLTIYLMIMAVLAGLFSFVRLGRNEDPSFVIKTMVVQAAWPAQASTTRSNKSPSGSNARCRKLLNSISCAVSHAPA